MKTKLLLSLALVLAGGLMGCRMASPPDRTENQQPDAVNNGLQMSLSVSTAHPTDPDFEVTIHNIGNQSVLLNLGTMLANGRVMMPDHIQLNLMDSTGKNQELRFACLTAISGRIDDYIVPLMAGSAYTVKVRLDQFWSPDTQEFPIRLKPGKYEVSAQLQGSGPGINKSGMEGIKLLNFWMGNLQSNLVFIRE